MTRVRRTLWLLVAAAVVALGILTRALAWPAGPAAGLTVAAAGVVLATSTALALRILVVIDGGRGRRHP